MKLSLSNHNPGNLQMKSKLLLIGGIIQILVAALHIGIFFGVASSELAQDTKISIHIFNAAVFVTVIFFAYVSLFRKRDLISTSFGRIVSGFIAVFYLQRGLVELFLRGFDAVSITLCAIITVLYVTAAWPEREEIVE
jgi:hypothetical protein